MYTSTTNGIGFVRAADGAWVGPEEPGFVAWLEAGNTPEPAPIPEPPVELTPAEKLAASGLTVDELKGLLGLT